MSTAITQWQTPGDEGGLRARRGEAALLDQPQLCGVGNGDQLPVLALVSVLGPAPPPFEVQALHQ